MTDTLTQSALGGALVIAGVVVKNSLEQLNKSPSPVGPVLFIAGWALFAYAVANNAVNNGTSQLPYIAAGIIAASVLIMKQNMSGGTTIPVPMNLLKLGFVAGWLLMAYSIGRHSTIAFVSVLAVLLSMMVLLPKQRAMNVVDGPGMPLFTAAWAGMIFANAL